MIKNQLNNQYQNQKKLKNFKVKNKALQKNNNLWFIIEKDLAKGA